MRLKQVGYTSYKTHSFCSVCDLWQSKDNKRCENCNMMVRHRPRVTRLKGEDRWKTAY